MLFAEVVACSTAVAATTSRRAKIQLLAGCLSQATTAELPAMVAWLSGTTRQRRTGVGWATLRTLGPASEQALLSVVEVDTAMQRAADASGPGSAGERLNLIHAVLATATREEQLFLRGLLGGGLRQGAAAGVMIEAVAVTAGQPSSAIRRALTFGGDLGAVAVAMREHGPAGLDLFQLRVGVPVAPMLAQSAPDAASALSRINDPMVDVKLDGIRTQIHRDGSDVAIFTRTLDDISARLPEVVDAARALPENSFILDGEAIAFAPNGRPLPFQVTSARAASRSRSVAESVPLTLKAFDVLQADGRDLLDEPALTRHEVLTGFGGQLMVPRLIPDPELEHAASLQVVKTFAAQALANGHEGVVVKSANSPYAMGRRGAAWVKVKPRLTADLVVLAVERGNGRRSGWLSNLHLGARDPQGRYGEPGGFVMLGKTFKGLSDAMLAWQSERLRELAVHDDGYTITVRPELVVEIAYDGVQSSSRYPAGMALRFARVVAHRLDRSAQDCDTVASVAAHHLPVNGASDHEVGNDGHPPPTEDL